MHYRGWKNSGLSAYDYFGNSYAANPLYVGYPGAGNPLYSNAIYARPLSRVPSPSNTILYWEAAARFATFATNNKRNGGEYDQNVPGCYWPFAEDAAGPAYGFHSTPWFFNVSFGDGHSSWIKIKGHGGIQETKAPPKCGGGVCACIYIRGLGWQLDTLPGDLIPTNKVRQGGGGTTSTRDGAGSEDMWDVVKRD
jgi:hypothetical protein